MEATAIWPRAEWDALRAREGSASDENFAMVEAFSRDCMLRILVHLTHDGYSITVFEWLERVPADLRGAAVLAFRATDMPRVTDVSHDDLVEYVERLRAGIRRRVGRAGAREEA
jgi:hypothetical protein